MPAPALALAIDSTSAVPPFEQLRLQLARLVAGGDLEPGTKLPTVRQLASDLGLAANTVARAYRELEADGVLVTGGRRGTSVHSEARSAHAQAELTRLAEHLVSSARRTGLSVHEATKLVEKVWRAADSRG
jgi:DNA-binding transcriptional regulator YhcF (GntR family)